MQTHTEDRKDVQGKLRKQTQKRETPQLVWDNLPRNLKSCRASNYDDMIGAQDPKSGNLSTETPEFEPHTWASQEQS